MNISHIEHIGIAVEDLNKAIAYYENILGLKCIKIEEVKSQKTKTAFFQLGQTKIELLQATEPDSPIGKFIEKKGEGLHHIAFAVDSVKKSIEEASQKGINLINNSPTDGADNMKIAFLHPKSTFGVLTEFCEKNK